MLQGLKYDLSYSAGFWHFIMRSSLLLLFPFLTLANNLYFENRITYSLPSADNTSKDHNSYFGYSVLLYSKGYQLTEGHESGMIVGAPNAHYTWTKKNSNATKKTGAVYRCPLTLISGVCVPVNVTNPEGHSFYVNGRFPATIETEHGGLGAALSESAGLLTVCAPRTTVLVHGKAKTKNIVVQSMRGACYNGRWSSGNISIEGPDFTNYGSFSVNYRNPSTGFAVHYPRSQKNSAFALPIIGSPLYNSRGTLHVMRTDIDTALKYYNNRQAHSLFGYAVSSGNYFDRFNLMVAAGAPKKDFTGQVTIMNYNGNTSDWSSVQSINGTDYKEYFGASLATGDLNNDGLDDLIVGAPHWKNDNGKVYIYMGSESRFSKANVFLEGNEDDALFGYALTSGDLDNDRYDDLIVSAPWERSGVIYIYNGHPEFGKKRSKILPSQKITASSDTRGFGFSLSNILDVNGDGFEDVAVGAYASGNALLFRSMPCPKVYMALETQTPILSPNAEWFVFHICVNRSSFQAKYIMSELPYIKYSVDQPYNRTSPREYGFYAPAENGCRGFRISLEKNISNYVDDIKIIAEYKYVQKVKCGKENGYCRYSVRCKSTSVTDHMSLSFEVPAAAIWAELEFPGLSNSTCIIGSNNLRLVLIIGNDGYSAYSTNVTFYIPKGVFLRRTLSSCHRIKESQAMRVMCNVGNPLEESMQKNISLDLDISEFSNVSLHGTKLDFSVDIRTRNVNEGMSTVVAPIQLEADVSIALSGTVYNETMYFGHDTKSTKLTFHHDYVISRFGKTPIPEVLLKILVPYKLECLKFLAIPRIIILGRAYECLVSDVLSKEGFAADNLSTKATAENRLQCDDEIPLPPYTQLKSANDDIIHLNCSSPNVTCEQVLCAIPFLGINERLRVELLIDITNLIDDQANDKTITINFATEASVHVQNSKMHFDVPGVGIPFPLVSTFYRIPKERADSSIFNDILKNYNVPETDIGYRIILGSILLGLLILGLIVCLLKYMGCFKRTTLRDQLKLLGRHPEEIEMHAYCTSEVNVEGHDNESQE